MDADITALRQQIADLQAALHLPLPAVIADLTRTQLATLQEQLKIAEYAITGTNIAAQNIITRDLNKQHAQNAKKDGFSSKWESSSIGFRVVAASVQTEGEGEA